MSEKHAEASDTIVATFYEYVNMSPKILEAWLKTDESKAVGQKTSERGESTGHESGRNIVKLLQKKRADYDEADRAEMHRIVGYIKRHLAQRPHKTDLEHTRWAYSLKNWGHDPGKE